MNRREILQYAAFTGAYSMVSNKVVNAEAPPVPASSPASFQLEEATLRDLAAAMQAGSLTSQLLTRQYLDRIDAVDKAGPELRAVIEINPDAMEIAKALDVERKSGKRRGPLHGMPVLIKD